MLEPSEQQLIREALHVAFDALRSSTGLHSGHHGDYVLPVLLLKYLSDRSKAGHSAPVESRTGSGWTVPAESDFDDLLAAGRRVGERIDRALFALESANPFLHGIVDDHRFNSNAFGDHEQRDRVLGQLLHRFNVAALDFRGAEAEAARAAAFACEVVINQAATESGKWGGQSFTPPSLSRLIAKLVRPQVGESVCDPCCGSGSMLIACSEFARECATGGGCDLFGQEINSGALSLAKINMALHGEVDARLVQGNTLRAPQFLAGVDRSKLQTFDVVVSSPPFNLKDWGVEQAVEDPFGRFGRGVPPRAAADYAFLSHMVAAMTPDTGRVAAIVSLGVLSRGGAEQQIRERLLRDNLIDAVIALPAKLLAHTGIAVALLLLRRRKADEHVLFINATDDYQHGKTQNQLREQDLTRIEETYLARQDVDRYARRVGLPEIMANEGNLSVPRYVDATQPTRQVDLDALRRERAALSAELQSLEARLATLLREVGHG